MKLKSLFIAICILVTTTFSKPSHAIVGIASWNPPLMGAGLAIHLGGVVVIAGAGEGIRYLAEDINQNKLVRILGQIIAYPLLVGGGLVGAFGVIVLDGADGSSITLTELTPSQAKAFGIMEEELLSYNAEIDQVNFIVEEVNQELVERKNPTAKDSAEAWSKVADAVSPETLKALEKVTAQWIK